MEPMRLGGLATGMNTEAMISKLMVLERRPLDLVQQQEAKLGKQKQAWSDISGVLNALKTTTDSLSTAATWQAATATSSDANQVVSVSGTPTVGAYNLTVTSLAQAEGVQSGTRTSETTALNLQGTFTIGTKSITLATTDTLDGVRDKINAAGAGVTAAVIQVSTGQFSLLVQSTKTGTANVVAYTDDAVSKPLQNLGLLTVGGSKNVVQAAKDAAFTINSISFTRSSNTVTDALTGVSLTLKAVNTTGFTVTVATDTNALAAKVNDFVTKFNGVIDKITAASGKGGALEGDGALLGLKDRLITQVMNSVSGITSGPKNLSQIGVTLDRSGHLNVDSSKLNAQLSASPSGVAALFTQATTGLAPATSNLVNGYTKTGGIVGSLTKSFDNQVQRLKARETTISAMLTVKEKTLRDKFNRMEKAISTLRNQGNWLASQLGTTTTSSSSGF